MRSSFGRFAMGYGRDKFAARTGGCNERSRSMVSTCSASRSASGSGGASVLAVSKVASGGEGVEAASVGASAGADVATKFPAAALPLCARTTASTFGSSR